MKKVLSLFAIIIIVLSLTACNKDAISFKKDYESLNGKVNASGKEHRSITIPKNNPIIISTPKEIVKKIENGDTFYVYFGSTLCPWCRSVIEKALEVAKDNDVTKIYYVDIWNDEGEEILRDKYTKDDNGNEVLLNEGTEEYYKLLDYFKDVLTDYQYGVDKNGGKRIYAPNFIYIAKGKAIRMTSGISSLQTDSREELTEEMLKDEEKQFDEFFINICDESC